jgi:hypothetical protein
MDGIDEHIIRSDIDDWWFWSDSLEPDASRVTVDSTLWTVFSVRADKKSMILA